MQFSSVVLPAPFGPMMPKTSPCSTAKVTPVRALTPPKLLLTSRSASRVMAAPTLTLPRKQGREKRARTPALTLPRKRGREIARCSCASLAQRLPEIAEREPAPAAEEVNHPTRNEDDAHGEQDAQADLGKDGP